MLLLALEILFGFLGMSRQFRVYCVQLQCLTMDVFGSCDKVCKMVSMEPLFPSEFFRQTLKMLTEDFEANWAQPFWDCQD